ncbi:hypothetical protein BDR04DRAFT_1167523 [Suillus decipiens]|nr:hypothetical protein BDR04DRAFT_1167523 [Suillus decipiens]
MLNTMLLANSKAHGIDLTMHMCDESCKQMQCHVEDKVIGWIEDKKKERLQIISILWRSQGLFSCRTDCWVDKTKKDHEERVLGIVWGIPNVVMLVDAWDVEYKGEPDSMLRIYKLHGKFSSGFHLYKVMAKRNILHGKLSPNNFIIFDGCGYFINFDHAQIIVESNTSVHLWGTGTAPYMSICLLCDLHTIDAPNDMTVQQTPSNDLESMFYVFMDFVSTFDGPQGMIIQPKSSQWADLLEDMGSRAVSYKLGLLLVRCNKDLMECTMDYFGGLMLLLQEWHLKFFKVDDDNCVTHEDIEQVLDKLICDEATDEPFLIVQHSLLSPLDALPPPGPHHSSWKTVPGVVHLLIDFCMPNLHGGISPIWLLDQLADIQFTPATYPDRFPPPAPLIPTNIPAWQTSFPLPLDSQPLDFEYEPTLLELTSVFDHLPIPTLPDDNNSNIMSLISTQSFSEAQRPHPDLPWRHTAQGNPLDKSQKLLLKVTIVNDNGSETVVGWAYFHNCFLDFYIDLTSELRKIT